MAIQSQTTDSRFLSLEEIEIAREIITGCFDKELNRIVKEEAVIKIKSFFFNLYFEERLYLLLIPKHLESLSETIFKDVDIRDFVLNLTDTVGVLLSVRDFSISGFFQTLANGFCLNKVPDGQASLINGKIRLAMKLDRETVLEIFQNNFWLAVLVFLYMFIPQTTSFIAGNESSKSK